MKKQLKNWQKFILPILATTTTLSSGAFILSSCVNKDKNTLSDKNIVLHDESPKENVIDKNTNLTLFVNVSSTKSLNYQWYVNKGKSTKTTLFTSSSNDDQWEKIESATSSSYSISSEDTKNVTTDTTWKYKVEISYEDDDASIKTTSNFYDVKIKANNTSTPDDSNPGQTPTEPSNPDTTPNPNPNPDTQPNPDTKPETPPSNGTSSSINSNSIKLKRHGQLLPSQYLTNLSKTELDINKIENKYDETKILNVSYDINSLDDSKGTLTLTMNYTENNNKLSYVFNFNNLLKLDDSGYNIEFENSSGIIDVSAQDIASKKIENNSQFKSLVEELNKNNINFKFKNKGNELPLDYLTTSGLATSGFGHSWFNSNSKINLVFTLKNPKINYYVKETNESLHSKSFDYPSNLNKQATIQFFSACDYLLNKITNNSNYSSNKHADYYYYDIKLNKSLEAQTLIANDKWLSNVINDLNYEGKHYVYKPELESEVAAYNGNLDVSLRMVLVSDNNGLLTRSQQTKNVQISGFTQYDKNNLFSSNPKDENKFSIYCDVDKYENNISILKRHSTRILNEINESEGNKVTIDSIPKEIIIKPMLSKLTYYFSGEKLTKEKEFYKNEYTAISAFDIDYLDVTLQYDKSNDVFQLVIEEFSIHSEELDYVTTDLSDPITINITHPNASLDKIKNNK